MNTFAERLKIAIAKRGISQAEAARICGIAQQSLNYIITNNLNSSKLAPQIAASLEINAEWLILGLGKFEENKVYELPILHSPYMLRKFIKNELDQNSVEYTVINVDLGNQAFAYLMESKKLIICSKEIKKESQNLEYLYIEDLVASVVTAIKGELSFPIYEWRIRSVDY